MAKTAWVKHLMKTFKNMKSKNKDAKLRDAMKVAGKTYKKKATKGGESAMPELPSMGGKKRTMKRKCKSKCKSKCKRKTKSMKGGQLSFSEYDSNPSLGGDDSTEQFKEDMEGGEDLMEMEGGIEEPFGTKYRIRRRRKRRESRQ